MIQGNIKRQKALEVMVKFGGIQTLSSFGADREVSKIIATNTWVLSNMPTEIVWKNTDWFTLVSILEEH